MNFNYDYQPPILYKKPVSIIVFGILCIVFGSFGLLSIIPDTVFDQNDAANDPILELMGQNELFATFMNITNMLSIFASIALILIGIGLLKIYLPARKAAIIYGFYTIISSVLMILFIFIFVYNNFASILGEFMLLFVVLLLFFAGLAFVFPILLIIFMRKPHIIEAFRLGPEYFRQMQQYMFNHPYNYPPQNPPYNYPQFHQQNPYYPQYPYQPTNPQYPDPYHQQNPSQNPSDYPEFPPNVQPQDEDRTNSDNS